MQRSNDVELMTSGVMQEALEIFACDRASLTYPCDPDTPTYRTVVEHTSPEYDGVLTLGQDRPLTPEWAEVTRCALHHPEAVVDPSLPPGRRERFRIASLLAIAVRPKGDRPYLFVVHCARSRPWTAAELRLFEETARRLGDALTSVLAHRNLLASEERYGLAMEASEEGHFDTDLETGRMFVSARLNEIYGFSRAAEIADRVEFLNRIPLHPDDRHLLADVIKPDWDDPARSAYDFECRIVPRAGEVRWIHTRGMVMRDAEGRARRRVGVVADITERKRAE
jgi:PAS domain S-box-containing protein